MPIEEVFGIGEVIKRFFEIMDGKGTSDLTVKRINRLGWNLGTLAKFDGIGLFIPKSNEGLAGFVQEEEDKLTLKLVENGRVYDFHLKLGEEYSDGFKLVEVSQKVSLMDEDVGAGEVRIPIKGLHGKVLKLEKRERKLCFIAREEIELWVKGVKYKLLLEILDTWQDDMTVGFIEVSGEEFIAILNFSVKEESDNTAVIKWDAERLAEFNKEISW